MSLDLRGLHSSSHSKRVTSVAHRRVGSGRVRSRRVPLRRVASQRFRVHPLSTRCPRDAIGDDATVNKHDYTTSSYTVATGRQFPRNERKRSREMPACRVRFFRLIRSISLRLSFQSLAARCKKRKRPMLLRNNNKTESR